MQSYTFIQLFIDCPQTKIVTWVYDTEIIIKKTVSRNKLHTILHLNVLEPPELYFGSLLGAFLSK